MFCAIVLQYNLLLIHETGQTRSHETSTVRLDRPQCNLTLITLVGLLQSRGPWASAATGPETARSLRSPTYVSAVARQATCAETVTRI